MTTGSLVGLVACLIVVATLGAAPPMILFGTALGACAGAVIGIQIWIETAPLPDDPVLPPAPGQERGPRR